MRRILLLALVLRLLAILFTRADEIVPRWPIALDRDGLGYASYAENLWKGKGYVEGTGDRSHRTPAYPLLIAGTFFLGGYQFLAVRILQALLGTLACWILGRLAAKGWGDRAGTWAALAAAVYPPFLFYTPQILVSILYMTLVSGTLLALVWAAEGGLRRSVLPGVLLGCSALTAGTVLGASPVMALWLAWRRRSLVPALLMTLATLAVIAPWTARNWKVHGGFVLLDTNSGGVLFLGNNNYAHWALKGEDVLERTPEYLRMDEYARDRMLRGKAMAWMKAHPGEFLEVWILKFLHGWSPVPSGKPFLLVLASLGTYGVALVLGLRGAWRAWKARSAVGILLILYLLSVSATHAVFVFAQRHRVPLLDPVLLVLGAV